MKLLIGGSPCTHWSIAQTKNRETEASGIGWELFLNYRIARDKYQPDYFLYENNKSMSSAIRAQITAELGVEPVLINSALVSAQNRQRLYWAGKRNPDGTYSQVPVELPEDRGILLRDILETKGALVVNALESWKSRMVDAHMGKLENNLVPRMNDPNPAKQQYDCIAEPLHVCAIDGEDAVLVDAEKNQTVRRSISDIVEKKGYLPEMFNPYNRAEVSEKAPTLSTGSMVTSSCAVLVVDGAVIKAAAPPMQVNEATKLGYTVIQPCKDVWTSGQRVHKFIGYDAGETRRIQHAAPIDEVDKKYEKHYPLYEWGWTREECVRVIERAGLPKPGKSSCFFCPSMKKKEIQALWENHPDLFQRAIDLEHGAAATSRTVKGLGRDWSWESYYNEFMANKEFEDAQITFDELFPDSLGGCLCGAPCGCYDG